MGKDYEMIATACSVYFIYLSIISQDGCIRIFEIDYSGTNPTCSLTACLRDHVRDVIYQYFQCLCCRYGELNGILQVLFQLQVVMIIV